MVFAILFHMLTDLEWYSSSFFILNKQKLTILLYGRHFSSKEHKHALNNGIKSHSETTTSYGTNAGHIFQM